MKIFEIENDDVGTKSFFKVNIEDIEFNKLENVKLFTRIQADIKLKFEINEKQVESIYKFNKESDFTITNADDAIKYICKITATYLFCELKLDESEVTEEELEDIYYENKLKLELEVNNVSVESYKEEAEEQFRTITDDFYLNMFYENLKKAKKTISGELLDDLQDMIEEADYAEQCLHKKVVDANLFRRYNENYIFKKLNDCIYEDKKYTCVFNIKDNDRLLCEIHNDVSGKELEEDNIYDIAKKYCKIEQLRFSKLAIIEIVVISSYDC